MRLFTWYFRLSWGQGMVVFGGIGIILLGAAAYMTWQQTVELLRWPRVDAHVESADVTTLQNTTGTFYAARLLLTYRFNGREYRVQTNPQQNSDEYADAAKEVLDANEAGHVTAMLDPRHPEVADPRLGPVWVLFVWPFVIGTLGLVFSGFGIAFWVMGRRQGFGKVADASTQDPRVIWPWFAGFGAVMLIAGVVPGLVGALGKSWIPVQAQVESADVVRVSVPANMNQQTNDEPMFAVRTWLRYSLDGRTYRTAVTAGTSGNDADEVAQLARAASVPRLVDVLIDPGNPYRVMTAHSSRLAAIMFPAIFGGFGVLFLGIGFLVRRTQSTSFHFRFRHRNKS